MSDTIQFDPNDPTLPANLPPDLRQIDAHLKDDGRYWQAHLPSEERLHRQARTMSFGNTATQPTQQRGFPFRAIIPISSVAVIVSLLATLFVVLAANRGNQTHSIAKATATPTSILTPPAPLSAYIMTYVSKNDYTISALNASNGQQRWQQQLHPTPFAVGSTKIWPIIVKPTILGDGKLFVFTDPGGFSIPPVKGDNNMLYSLRVSDGKVLWHVSLSHPMFGAVYANGIIYTGSLALGGIPADPNAYVDAYVDAYRASDGKLLWEHSSAATCDNRPDYEPLAADANAVYVSYGCVPNNTAQTSVIALRAADGSQLWSYPAYTGGSAGPALVNGVLYFVNINSGITALRVSDGTQVWHVQEGALTLDNYSGSLQAQNGTIYVTYNRNSIYHLYALRANDGKLLWSKQIPYLVDSLAAANGTVYYTHNADLFAMNAKDGSQHWHRTEPVTAAEPHIFVTATDNAVYFISASTAYALRPTDGSIIWQYQSNTGNGILVG
jgi:outer membrane protein assembly factor BamB